MPGIRHLEGFVVARNRGFPGLGLVAHPRRILSRRGNIHLDYLWCSFFQEHEATHHSNSRPKGLLKRPCLIITIAYTAWCLQISECFQEKNKCSALISVKSLYSLLFPTLSTYSPKLVALCHWWCSPCSNSPQLSKCLETFYCLCTVTLMAFVGCWCLSQRLLFYRDFSGVSQITVSMWVPSSWSKYSQMQF